MNILLIGNGGREHAFAWKMAQSPLCTQLYIASGNAGTAEVGSNVSLNVLDFEQVSEFIRQKDIDFVVVGPEQPLVEGIADYLKEVSKKDEKLKNLAILAPSAAGAKLEGSKDFAKAFMKRNGVQTAASETFTAATYQEGINKIEQFGYPIVLKADGLAAGKGVVIVESRSEAEQTLKAMLLEKQFGAASEKVVLEQFLKGIEVSFFVLTDGKDFVLLPEAKDYKRIGEGDTGLNTGGMGAVSPVPFVNEILKEKIMQKIIKPTLDGLKNEQIDFCGFIFFGLMIQEGEPYLLEYNTRMGDPETEVVLPRIESDLVELLYAAAQGKLKDKTLKISDKYATTVMLVSGGYPQEYAVGKPIKGLDKLATDFKTDLIPFQAGTKTDEKGDLVTAGGRVLALTAKGDSLEDALQKSLKAAQIVEFEGKYFRADIGRDLLK
ncbi:phosphoribosylamine--glycine ligase [Hugenholtzia roseola]|uniref:phosphoribosylamine--glycine ligase n=1 Tax=Hugenholtzia roseola TaxID=1002 RepID=UPI00041F01A4|nr:phosphoribosylamine--glycine ligase [Hugenholtzia roseola]